MVGGNCNLLSLIIQDCIDAERTVKGKITREQRYYISSLPPDPAHLGPKLLP